MIEKYTLKSGHQSILVNGIRYHSSYNPQNEAERFISNTIGNTQPSTVIICGAGIGYLIDAVKNRFPYAKRIILFYKKELSDLCDKKNGFFWHPGMENDIKSFLSEVLSELDIEGLKTIEWPAGVSLFPEISNKVHTSLSQIIKEKRGTIVTSIAMGKLWIRNSIRNFIHIDDVYTGNPLPQNNPVVLTASGPSLEKSMNILKKWRNKIHIISLPSAVRCLIAHNILPDTIVMTDPGHYSMHHLQWTGISSSIIFIPLSAAIGIWETPLKVILFSQPHFFEKQLLKKTGCSYPSIPPKGTVAATALEIALGFSKSEVIIAGLDLCYQDILSHSRPHTFDTLLHISANRISPFYSLKYRRSHYFAPTYNNENKTRTSLALKTYEGWFQSLDHNIRCRLIRLNPSPVVLHSTQVMQIDDLEQYLSHKKHIIHTPEVRKRNNYPQKEARQKIVKEILAAWNTEIEEAGRIIKDLNTLGHLTSNNRLLKLLYFINLTQLSHIKRKVRLHGEAAGIEPALSMLDNSKLFIQNLYNKLTKGYV